MLDELIEIRMRRRGLARTNHARETGEMSRDSQLMTQVYRPSCLVPSPSLLSGCLGLPASHVVAGWPHVVPVSRCLVQSVIRHLMAQLLTDDGVVTAHTRALHLRHVDTDGYS